MKFLHIFRTPPDDTVLELLEAVTTEGDDTTFEPLFIADIDWDNLVDEIFTHEKVICWW